MLTCGIKHWGLGGYSSILSRIKFSVTGQDSSPHSPTISYRQPLAFTLKSVSLRKKSLKKEKILKNELYLPNNVKTKLCQ